MDYLLNQDVRIASVEEQLIIMDTAQGKFYTCNAVGSMVLKMILDGRTLDSVIAHLAEHSKHSTKLIHDDVFRFVDSLVEKKLCHASE